MARKKASKKEEIDEGKEYRLTVRLQDFEYEIIKKKADKWTRGNVSLLLRIMGVYADIKWAKHDEIKNVVEFYGKTVRPH